MSCPEQHYSFLKMSSLVCFLKDLFYKMDQNSAENALVHVAAFLGMFREPRGHAEVWSSLHVCFCSCPITFILRHLTEVCLVIFRDVHAFSLGKK